MCWKKGGDMKNPEISFRIFGSSGPLSIYWFSGSYGEAIESIDGSGVGWFSPSFDLLGVEFDDVEQSDDEQKLIFENGARVKIKTSSGKVEILEVVQAENKKSA